MDKRPLNPIFLCTSNVMCTKNSDFCARQLLNTIFSFLLYFFLSSEKPLLCEKWRLFYKIFIKAVYLLKQTNNNIKK